MKIEMGPAMDDILFDTEGYIFSYRVAGICIQNGKVLLQKPAHDTGFAFPGGHVVFGDTNEQTLVREFKEEIGISVKVGELKWVAEIFFPWKSKSCHQICLYYLVEILTNAAIPLDAKFTGREHFEGKEFVLEFYWIPLDEVKRLKIYPTDATELLGKLDSGVQHFVYKEK